MDAPQLLHVLQVWRQSRGDTQNTVLDQGCKGHAVEHVNESFPRSNIQRALTLIIKPIDPRYAATFVFASKQANLIWIGSLVQQQKGKGVNWMPPAADIIAKE